MLSTVTKILLKPKLYRLHSFINSITSTDWNVCPQYLQSTIQLTEEKDTICEIVICCLSQQCAIDWVLIHVIIGIINKCALSTYYLPDIAYIIT